MQCSILYLSILALYINTAFAAFGVTTSGNNFVVDSGAGLVTTIDKSNGDITSLVYFGNQLQDSSKFSQLNSGLGSATVTSSVSNNIAVITVKTSTITHYYVVRSGETAVYMGTYASAEPSDGELYFIARLSKSAFPYWPNDISGGAAIEGSDVYKVNGETRSKFYSSPRLIDERVRGAAGKNAGAYILFSDTGYETSSGGPFFRDIEYQGTAQRELYAYLNSGHAQTEKFRTGFFGPYALVITSNSPPYEGLDTSFFSALNLQGYVPASGRGKVQGTYSGALSGLPVTIGFKNSAAQYWVTGSGGSFTTPLIKPGTYTATLYEGELESGTASVTVSAGGTASLSLRAGVSRPSTVWRIGSTDGTPSGFLNSDKIELMHPSDSRMSNWGPITYDIDGLYPSSFPMAQWVGINNPTTITWNAPSSQVGARTLRIRTTSSFAGARPQITVNNWKSSAPAAPPNIDVRVTRGTWRGINQIYDFAIPSGTLVAGKNALNITIISESSGNGFLSPHVVYDSVELF